MSSEPPPGGAPGGYGGPPHGQEPYGFQPYPSGTQYGGPDLPPPQRHPYPYPPHDHRVRPPLPPTSPDPLVPFSLGDWVGKVVGTVQRSWRPLLVIQALVLVPVLLLQIVSTGTGWSGRGVTAVLPALLVVALATAAVAVGALGAMATVFVVVRDAAQRPYRPDQVLAFVRHRAGAAVGWTLVAAAAVTLVTVVLSRLLPLFALLPMAAFLLYAGTVLTALPGVVAIERTGPSRMFWLVHQRLFPTLGRVALTGLAAAAAALVIGVLSAALTRVGPFVADVVSVLLTLPIGVVGAAVVVVLYAENRFHDDEAVHTPVLADEIDRP